VIRGVAALLRSLDERQCFLTRSVELVQVRQDLVTQLSAVALDAQTAPLIATDTPPVEKVGEFHRDGTVRPALE
jgi:hypothetical protein